MPKDERARRIYIGNIPPDMREDDVRDKFKKYGHIEYIDLKSRGGGPVFAFMDYEDPRDADDAVRARDGYSWDGYRLRVEFPRGVGPRGAGGVPVSELDRGGGRSSSRHGGGGRGGGGDRGGPPRRSRYRVYVSGLPSSGSWQDLKDHLRNAGEICYADVFRDGTGVVEFARMDDMKTALRKFDDTKFRSHGGETSYIRLKEEGEGGARGSRSRSGSHTPPRQSRRSPSYGRAGGGGSRSRSGSREAAGRRRSGSREAGGRRRRDSRSRSYSR